MNCFKEEQEIFQPTDCRFGSDKNPRMSCQNVALPFKPLLYLKPYMTGLPI